jgi:hypothetical protein
MSRFGAQWDDYEQDKEHKARRALKMQRIQGLKDLLDTHEANADTYDHEYVLSLRARLRAAQNQLEAMAV